MLLLYLKLATPKERVREIISYSRIIAIIRISYISLTTPIL